MPFLPKLHSTVSNNSVLSPSSSHTHHRSHTPSLHHSNNNSAQNLNSSGNAANAVHGNNNIDKHVLHPLELSLDLESPPVILYGPPNESSGSLISGQLHIEIPKDAFKHSSTTSSSGTSSASRPSNKRTHSSNTLQATLSNTLSNLNLSPSHSRDISPVQSTNNSYTNLAGLMNIKDHVLVNSVQLCLVQKIQYAKPFLPPSNTLANCSSCKKKSTELARWDILTQAHNLPVGKHSYPFSHLLPGNLPATSSVGSSSLTTIKYEMIAICSYNNHSNHQSMIKITLPLNISRSILRGPDRNSLRVFPPTDVTATAVLPNVVYPKSSFALELKLDGVASNDRRWRMRRVGWRIEENTKIKTNSCINHKSKLKVVEEHVRKNQHAHKPANIKRTQQSGPTTAVSVSNTPQLSPTITPSQSNANLTTAQTQEALAPTNSNDDISSIHTSNNPNLHPSDHANEEIRQQHEEEINHQTEEERKKDEMALYAEETRTVAAGDLRNGWKSDFSGKGKIELVADISCFNLTSAAGPHYTHVTSKDPIDTTHPHHHANVSCDLDDPILGVTVNHVLIVEVVVAEEVLQQSSSSNSLTPSNSHKYVNKESNNKPDQRLAELSPMFANHIKPTQTTDSIHSNSSNRDSSLQNSTFSNSTKTTTTGAAGAGTGASSSSSSQQVGVPTGAARVLRMQFKLIVTERSGLGIAWDDEVPPTYEDVSALSPPTYDKTIIEDELNSPINNGLSSDGTNPPLYPLNFAPVHTHTHINGQSGGVGSNSTTPGVINGIGNTPGITPRPSNQYHSINGALEMDDFTLG